MTKRLNIRIADEDYAQLQALRRAYFETGDSGTVRRLIIAAHASLKASGALRVVDTLERKTTKTLGRKNGRKKRPNGSRRTR